MSDSEAPAVSVIVCSHDGARTIGACLEALQRQTIRHRAQVIVVDDGSADRTADVARSHGVDIAMHEHNQGLSAARNTGLAMATAPVVAFTDDDCIPDPRWLEALAAAHEDPRAIAVGGPVEIARTRTLVHRYLADHPPLAPLELELEEHASLPARFAIYLKSMWLPSRPSHGRAVYSFPGANMSFKRSALVAVGGFNPELRFGSDDEYICDRIRDRFPTSVLWFDPGAVVRHDYVGTLKDVVRRNYAYGRGQAQMYLDDAGRKWPIVFPIPLALGALAVTWRRPGRILLTMTAVQSLYPQGIMAALRSRRPANLAFSWVRLAEESAHNLGMLAGLLDRRETRERRTRDDPR